MARDLASHRGCKVRELWLDPTPAGNMKRIALEVICAVWTGDTPVLYERLTERVLEKRFGRIRSGFASANMSAGYFFRSSLYHMQRELKQWHEKPHPKHAASPEPMNQNTFCATASRAFQSALKLSAMCSRMSRADLQAAFNVSRGQQYGDADGQEDDDCSGRVCQIFPSPKSEPLKFWF